MKMISVATGSRSEPNSSGQPMNPRQNPGGTIRPIEFTKEPRSAHRVQPGGASILARLLENR